ncbi:MAG: hypothetical protein O3A13_13995 [Proteobacteria bacterium]|nr:hypothetical protein [Pseudomonadota bacterium]
MHRQYFRELRSHLIDSGVAPKHVRRLTAELSDHLDDLRNDALMRDLSELDAERFALKQLGNQKIIAQKILERTELKTWIYRYPRVACIYLPVAYALLLPVSPVFAGIANPSIIVRWGAALMLGGIITAAMFLGMELAIVLT